MLNGRNGPKIDDSRADRSDRNVLPRECLDSLHQTRREAFGWGAVLIESNHIKGAGTPGELEPAVERQSDSLVPLHIHHVDSRLRLTEITQRFSSAAVIHDIHG